MARASTIKVHDTYMGTDKFGHFIGWGYLYYLQYQASRGPKTSQEESLRAAVSIGHTNPVGEDGIYAYITNSTSVGEIEITGSSSIFADGNGMFVRNDGTGGISLGAGDVVNRYIKAGEDGIYAMGGWSTTDLCGGSQSRPPRC